MAAQLSIAVGGPGPEAPIETADVVIQPGHPGQIAPARCIAHATHRVV